MATPVKLYVYDLSNGLARQLSLQLTGRQINGIWHTSVVVFGKEIFYGQGISITAPGKSHHGQPLQVVDVGETALDEATFEEYLHEMRDHYTADKYHLLDFNCNSFTNDCVGFLTGGSIPAWISDLPADFLSTPFGAALRPTIDAMFRRPAANGALPPPVPPAQAAASASPNPALASSLLEAFAARAQGLPNGHQPQPSPQPAASATSTLAAPIHLCTNASSFTSLLKSHRAIVALFTNPATCPPCRMIEPTFESLAHEKKRAAFVKIDLAVGMSGQLAGQYGVRVTPTFLFFLDGKKTSEMKGASAQELRTNVDLLLFEAFPPHPHSSLSLPAVEAISLEPILFKQVPALDAVQSKLLAFIEASSSLGAPDKQQIKDVLTARFVPYLKQHASKPTATGLPAAQASGIFSPWASATSILSKHLPITELFPLVDLWRLALLDPSVAGWCASLQPNFPDPIEVILTRAIAALDAPNSRNYLLTALRMVANAFSLPLLARRVIMVPSGSGAQLSGWRRTTAFLVPALLHEDATVRTAAASVAFNVSAWLQKGRVQKLKGSEADTVEEDGEWEVEMVSAVVESLSRETQSQDVVHRLVACLAFLLRLSPIYEEQIVPLLEVLQARDALLAKLQKGGCGDDGVQKADVRKLIAEVAEKLCTA